MTSVESRLRELGDRLVLLDGDTTLPTSTLRRIKRRRRGTTVAGTSLILMLALTTTFGIVNLDSPARGISPAQAPPEETEAKPTGPSRGAGGEADVTVGRDEFFGAVWPEDSREETSEGCSRAEPFRTDALGTAVEFGRSVLEWDDAHAVVRDRYRNSAQIELSRAGDTGSAVYLSMVEYAQGCWSVQSVGTNLGGVDDTSVRKEQRPGGVTVDNTPDRNVFSVAFQAPPGSSGRVELAFGDYRDTKRWSGGAVGMQDPVTFTVGPSGPYDSGHYLILFEDESGNVTTAAGNYLNPSKGLARPTAAPTTD